MHQVQVLRYQVPKIFPLLSTLYILERLAGKICIHLSQFSETEALCSKNISIMPALCLMLQIQYYAQNYADIIQQTLTRSEVVLTLFFFNIIVNAFKFNLRPPLWPLVPCMASHLSIGILCVVFESIVMFSENMWFSHGCERVKAGQHSKNSKYQMFQ